MHAMMPLLQDTDFPKIRRGKLDTLQVNLGYKCNQSCLHCHVNAGPTRKEMMTDDVVESLITFIKKFNIQTLDVTGGAPEMHPKFRYLVTQARKLDVRVIDRCNLTILEEPEHEDTAQFLADNQVEITASLPCYLEDNVDKQRGNGVFQSSMRALQTLNKLGYGKTDSPLILNLVYNPVGAYLPPEQTSLEFDYKRELKTRFGITFNQLLTITNMPIARFGSTLVSKGEFEHYMTLLRNAYKTENLQNVMCRSLISIDYQGYVYDCDFNQMLNMPLAAKNKQHINDLMSASFESQPIAVADHCYGCTAGQGSSCGGALT